MNTQQVFKYADKSLDPAGLLALGLVWLGCRWFGVQLDQDEIFVIGMMLGAARILWERYKRKRFMTYEPSLSPEEPPEPKHL